MPDESKLSVAEAMREWQRCRLASLPFPEGTSGHEAAAQRLAAASAEVDRAVLRLVKNYLGVS